MKKNNNFNAFSISVIALLVVAILGTGVYAYYQTQISGTASVTAVDWEFTVDGETATFNKSFGPLKPGYEGEIDFVLGAKKSGVDVDWTISANYAADSDTITNLKFYTTRSGSAGNYTYEGEISELSTTAKQLTSGELTKGSEATVKIYVVWPYGDASSVTADTAEAGKSVTLDLSISGTQKHA